MLASLPTRLEGILLTTTASVLWGTVFIAIGVGLQYTNPYNLVFLRFAVASSVIVLVAIALRRVHSIASELSHRSTWFLGAIYALGFILQYVGQSLTNASDATLLSNLAPTLVPIITLLLLGEAITTAQKSATVLGFVGLLLIVTPKSGLGSGNVLGELVLFATSVTYAFFIILSKRLKAVSIGKALAIIISITIFLAPISAVLGGFSPSTLRLGAIGWFSVLYLGIVCSALAIALYLKGLSSISTSESATLLLLQILVGLILAATILRESLDLPEMAGAASILTAIILSSLGARSNPRPGL